MILNPGSGDAMRCFHRDFKFELSDEWWDEAGMRGFIPAQKSYYADLKAFLGWTVYEIRVDEVEPVRRQLSHGVFNDDAETGRSAKDRVLDILRGFTNGAAIPPVDVIQVQGADYRYKLTHGAHRFYCSVAAGFSYIPARIVE